MNYTEEFNKKISIIETRLSKGFFFDAHNETVKLIKEYPDNKRLRQLYGLSLARLGETGKAKTVMEKLYLEDGSDPETAGILGRTYKDIAKKTENIKYAAKSRDIYLKAYKENGDYYNGINAASMSLIAGDKTLSAKLANEVINIIYSNEEKDFWETVTLGEAYLLVGKPEKSIEYYKEALNDNKNFGNINSSYQQLIFLKKYLDIPEEILNILKPPTIVIFTGHMIDKSDRKSPRFPNEISEDIKLEIASRLSDINASIGYSSASCGADILFIEAMLERNAEINVFLPFCKDDFLKTSVSYAGDEWVQRFENVMKKVTLKYITNEQYFKSNELFSFLNSVLSGLANLRGRLLSATPYLLAVLNENESETENKEGGAGDFRKYFRNKDRIITIDTSVFIKKNMDFQKNSEEFVTDFHNPPYGIKRKVKSILFSDIVGYSKINDEQTPYFMYELLQEISNRLKKNLEQPEILNTWGDAIFAVFSAPIDAANMAFMMRDLILETNWKDKNLPEDMNIRIALHAGPVFLGNDPITGNLNAFGSHINRTARIEPVTIPGCIYASEQFASLLVNEQTDFYFEYVGMIELYKKFGYQEIYHISKNDDLKKLTT